MADLKSLSAAHVIILATDLCANADYERLQALQHQRPDVLGAELCYRILLTFVSGSDDVRRYVPFLKQLRGVSQEDVANKSIDTTSVEGLSEVQARARIRQLRLERLNMSNSKTSRVDDMVAQFIVQQAYRLDQETGDLPTILQLVEPFVDQIEPLCQWLISYLLPLLRLDYEYYSEGGSGISLEAFGGLEGMTGLDFLLQRANSEDGKHNIGQDLRGIVGPWMHGARASKRRKLNPSFRRASIGAGNRTTVREDSGWQDVNEWILKKGLEDFDIACAAVAAWDGPKDIDLGGYDGPLRSSKEDEANLSMKYAQAALAVVYGTDDTTPETTRKAWGILERVPNIVGSALPHVDTGNALPDRSSQSEGIAAFHRSELSSDALLDPDHALTWPSISSLEFLQAILTSIRVLREDLCSQQPLSCHNVTTLCLFGEEQSQRQELRGTLQHLARVAPSDADWQKIREKVLWLSIWKVEDSSQPAVDRPDHRAVFWRVSREDVETELFNAMLAAKQYSTAIAVYLSAPSTSPLPQEAVQRLVEREMLNAYDNASNGNRNRGGMRRASEILEAFSPHFPPSSPVNKTEHLLAATHSLSFYHLTLQHGVPFQPVSIRIHQDPISFISKVLEQNSKAYTKLDDLLSIGRGLVAAGLPASAAEERDELENVSDDSLESKMLESDHRITYEAIIAALSSNDFDTAYSYILTRLSPSTQPSDQSAPIDDTSWRAAYAAGRHRPAPSSPAPAAAHMSLLSKRLDLLSLALTLVPDPAHLPAMLTTWQKCEDELDRLRAQEAAEEKAWNDKGDHISSVPGGFGMEEREVDMRETRREGERRRENSARRRYDEDEAPMGLFDVARGAARAVGRTAFPLRAAAGGEGVQVRDEPARWSDEYARSTRSAGSAEDGQQRVRKRDMVSNMVTGGLVSGLGWVLGAQPADQQKSMLPSQQEGR